MSSQWCRCKDTAKYAFNKYKEFSSLNSTFSPPYDKKEKQQIKELKKFVKKWNGKGGNLILVTHYVVILALTGQATSSGEIVITDKNSTKEKTSVVTQRKIEEFVLDTKNFLKNVLNTCIISFKYHHLTYYHH